jgi:hypothetical protein
MKKAPEGAFFVEHSWVACERGSVATVATTVTAAAAATAATAIAGTRTVRAAETAFAAATAASITTAAAFAATTPPVSTAATFTAAAPVAPSAATATTAAIAAATPATESTTAGRARFHRAGFVDYDATASQGLAVHAVDRGQRFCITPHFHEAKALGSTRVALHHDLGTGYSTELAEGLFQITVAHRVRQIANVEFVAHRGTPQKHMNKAMESRKRSQLISMTLSAKLTDHRKLGKRGKPRPPTMLHTFAQKASDYAGCGLYIRRGHKKRSPKAPFFPPADDEVCR